MEEDIEKALQVLRAGGVILYPTDTVWGLGCDATSESAVAKIYEIKKREPGKSLIVLLAEEREILQWVAQVDLQVFDFLQSATKPTTVIYEGAIGFAENLSAADGTVAIRIVKDEFCRHLVKRFRKPIVSTSANFSGEPSPSNFKSISQAIKKAVDYVVHFRQDEITPASPSTLIKWNSDGSHLVIRP